MKTKEKFAAVDAVIANTGMTEKEPLCSETSEHIGRHNSINISVVYKKGNEFEVLPYLDLNRKEEVWGFELLPGIVLAKKCGGDGNVENTNWGNSKAFAEKCKLNGKKGSLPSKEVLKKNWSKELVDKIRAMDKFLCDNSVDAETRSTGDIRFAGLVWCSEVYDYNFAYYFDLRYGNDFFHQKNDTIFSDRLAVAF